MTEDIGSDKHKRPSQEIEVAIIKERLREAAKRDEALLSSNAEIVKSINEMKLILNEGKHRMNALETLQDETSTRITVLEQDKRGPIAIIMATLSAIGAGVAAWIGVK